MRATLRRHRVACYVAITFAVTWSAWLFVARTEHTVGAGFSPLYMLGLIGPLLGAVITTALVDGTSGLRELGGRMIRVGRIRWWGVAALPLVVAGIVQVALIAYSMFLLAPTPLPDRTSLGQFTGFPITSAFLLAPLLILVNGFGEETGWRGFLLPELRRRFSPLTASVLVAFVWAAWHAPAFLINENYRAMPIAMLPMFVVGLVGGSVFLTWLYTRARKSIALVATWHGLFNLFTGTVAARGVLAAAETTVVMVIAAVLVVLQLSSRSTNRRSWSRSSGLRS